MVRETHSTTRFTSRSIAAGRDGQSHYQTVIAAALPAAAILLAAAMVMTHLLVG